MKAEHYLSSHSRCVKGGWYEFVNKEFEGLEIGWKAESIRGNKFQSQGYLDRKESTNREIL